MTIRVAVTEAHSPARSGLRLIIDSAPDVAVLGDFPTAEKMLGAATGLRPDVVVMDGRQPGSDELDHAAVRRVVSELRCGVVVLTIHDHDRNLFGALAAGACAFVSADTEPHVVLAAVRAVASGGSWLGPRHTRRLVEEYGRALHVRGGTGRPAPNAAGSAAGRLSERENEVLALVGRGRTNQEIADCLTLSPLTAKTYVSRIMAKLGARDRVQLALIAAGHQRGPSGARPLPAVAGAAHAASAPRAHVLGPHPGRVRPAASATTASWVRTARVALSAGGDKVLNPAREGDPERAPDPHP
ncbi:response regulator transcription factor [Streptomyces lonarensis]|uniref:Response regulator transcription factor n=1 Tax=Streptomyces lonarensis TaxID=700599 RepID=A0A7X6CY07_9ACTN|nr:response regulator transcription factor [Streptomyces lonarensis]NJQ04657.1 response regulator transcription factor [Streptomyces lonarensis]